jgi:hypothetical protein
MILKTYYNESGSITQPEMVPWNMYEIYAKCRVFKNIQKI